MQYVWIILDLRRSFTLMYFQSPVVLDLFCPGKATSGSLWSAVCLGKRKIFIRVNDLKQHVLSSHLNVVGSSPTTFFTAATWFYLAVHPDDYRKIVNIKRYEQDECYEAMKAVLRWCISQLNASNVTQEYRKGGFEAKATQPPELDKQKRQADWDMKRDLWDNPEVYLDDLVTFKRSKDKPLDYTSGERTRVSNSLRVYCWGIRWKGDQLWGPCEPVSSRKDSANISPWWNLVWQKGGLHQKFWSNNHHP